MIMILTAIIIPKGGYGSFHKVQKQKEKKQQRPAMLFRNYKINTYLVREILFSVLLKCFSVHDNKSLNIHAICNRIIAHCPHLNHEIATYEK